MSQSLIEEIYSSPKGEKCRMSIGLGMLIMLMKRLYSFYYH